MAAELNPSSAANSLNLALIATRIEETGLNDTQLSHAARGDFSASEIHDLRHQTLPRYPVSKVFGLLNHLDLAPEEAGLTGTSPSLAALDLSLVARRIAETRLSDPELSHLTHGELSVDDIHALRDQTLPRQPISRYFTLLNHLDLTPEEVGLRGGLRWSWSWLSAGGTTNVPS